MFPNLRLRSLFGQTQYPPEFGMPTPDLGADVQMPEFQLPPNIQMESNVPMDFNPEMDMQNYFNQLVQNAPQRNDPSILRRIGASIVGLGAGPKAAEHALYAPYYQELQDWQTQLDPAYKAANLERQGNINERQLSYQRGKQDLEERKLTENERKNREAERVRDMRAKAYDFRARNPLWKAVATKGGRVHFVNSQNPSEKIDTGIDTGTLSDYDRINLQIEGKLEGIEAQGENAAELERQRQEGRMELEGERGTQRRRTQAEKPVTATGAGTKPELPGQTKIRQYLKAREIANSNPELAKYIKLGNPGTNDFRVNPPNPGKYWSTGPSVEDYQKIYTAIYGAPDPAFKPTPGGKNTVTEEAPPKGARAGGYWYTTKSGKKIWREK